MNKLQKMIVASKNGIRGVRPYQAMKVSDATGIPFPVLCAVLEKESSGGRNEFGHDPTVFVGAGHVTKKKYKAYLAERDMFSNKRMQGVGPMQLTYYTYQDRADSLGGCWKPEINMTVGAQLLMEYWNQYHDWVQVGAHYNGALAYGIDLKKRIDTWTALLS